MSKMAGTREIKKAAVILALLWMMPSCLNSPPEPVEVAFNEDTCSRCRMALSDKSFAAEAVSPDGHVDFFDDIGCLARWLRERDLAPRTGIFVLDYQEHEWLNAEAAHYVLSDRLPTPMGYGLAALRSRAAAEKLAANTGARILTWEQVLGEAG